MRNRPQPPCTSGHSDLTSEKQTPSQTSARKFGLPIQNSLSCLRLLRKPQGARREFWVYALRLASRHRKWRRRVKTERIRLKFGRVTRTDSRYLLAPSHARRTILDEAVLGTLRVSKVTVIAPHLAQLKDVRSPRAFGHLYAYPSSPSPPNFTPIQSSQALQTMPLPQRLSLGSLSFELSSNPNEATNRQADAASAFSFPSPLPRSLGKFCNGCIGTPRHPYNSRRSA